jgi:transformation/transcription domain-associated protein
MMARNTNLPFQYYYDRPLAFSMLADLVHHVRTKLALPQLSRTVYMYSRNLHDNTLACSIQTMCAKLLLNLVECIMHLPDRTKGTFNLTNINAIDLHVMLIVV